MVSYDCKIFQKHFSTSYYTYGCKSVHTYPFSINLFNLSLTAIYVDQYLGFENGFLSSPFNYYLSGIMFVIGVILWIWTYEQLTRLGEGSPSPAAGRTIKLAQEEIAAYSRNPSLFGKLTGFVAVGVTKLFLFCFILTPILLCGSLMEKVIKSETTTHRPFLEEYLEYKEKVPLFIPWTFFLKQNEKIK